MDAVHWIKNSIKLFIYFKVIIEKKRKKLILTVKRYTKLDFYTINITRNKIK